MTKQKTTYPNQQTGIAATRHQRKKNEAAKMKRLKACAEMADNAPKWRRMANKVARDMKDFRIKAARRAESDKALTDYFAGFNASETGIDIETSETLTERTRIDGDVRLMETREIMHMEANGRSQAQNLERDDDDENA